MLAILKELNPDVAPVETTFAGVPASFFKGLSHRERSLSSVSEPPKNVGFRFFSDNENDRAKGLSSRRRGTW